MKAIKHLENLRRISPGECIAFNVGGKEYTGYFAKLEGSRNCYQPEYANNPHLLLVGHRDFLRDKKYSAGRGYWWMSFPIVNGEIQKCNASGSGNAGFIDDSDEFLRKIREEDNKMERLRR